jgi:precorrin-6Y C5,15-methyltransferase (decarboxylating)
MNTFMYDIYVIGIGYKPLDPQEHKILYKSDIILSSERLLEVFKMYREFKKVQKRVVVLNTVDETIEFIRSRTDKKKGRSPVAVLASGDPLFFGIGRRILIEFGKERVEIMPDLSSIQVAFSRIREPWDNAFLMSLHRGPDPKRRRNLKYEMKDIPSLLERHKKLAILTDRESNPSEIAKVLVSSNVSQPSIFVCEKLGDPGERIIRGTPEEIAAMSFSTPNVVIVLCGEEG